MDKDSAQRTRPCRAALRRKSDSCTPPQPPAALAEDGRTRRTKRKTSPDKTNPRKRTRLSESEGRKEVPDMAEAPPKKIKRKRRLLRYDSNDPLEGCSSDVDNRPRRGAKRKAATDGEEPNGKRKRSEEEGKEVPNRKMLSVDARRAKFEGKYIQQELLGEGGCGSVYAGYRKADKLPVAIKHVARDKVFIKHLDNNGNRLSVEVAVLLKLADATNGPVGTSAVISLLDWYDLDQKLILVMERPVPSEDLLKYVEGNGGNLQEDEAKVILKQLVDAALKLQENHVFHRDIKVENILIETGSDVPRVRLIDFGLSCFVKKGSFYRSFFGTADHIPPEMYVQSLYKAGPTTVWQLGVVLFETVHSNVSFETTRFLGQKLRISRKLSKDCQDFLRRCLTIDPKDRITLQQLQLHPWLR